MVWSAHGTMYPNAEIWVCGGPRGPELLLDYRTGYSEPIMGLGPKGDLTNSGGGWPRTFIGPWPTPTLPSHM